MFIGRERELTALQNQYNSSKFEFTVIYGRRRVGKTAIINEFVKDKDVIYFTGVESNEKQNLENFSQSIMSYKSDLPQGSEFTSFQGCIGIRFQIGTGKTNRPCNRRVPVCCKGFKEPRLYPAAYD